MASAKEPAIDNNNLGGKRKRKLRKVKIRIHNLNFDMHPV